MTVTGLEHVPNGQSARGGSIANNVGYKAADYFNRYCSYPLANVKNMNSRVHKMKKKK